MGVGTSESGASVPGVPTAPSASAPRPAPATPTTLYARLRADILAGSFAAGSVLQETHLTARYGVSRTPIREALVRLEQDGLVERASRGLRVRSGTAEDVLEIYEARIALEGVAAASAAARRSDLELARLERLHTMSCATADGAEARRLNALWHEELWASGRNATVRALLVRLTAQLRIYDGVRVESEEDLLATRAEHEEVMAALRSRDPERARLAVVGHLERSREIRLRLFTDALDLPRREQT